MIAIPEDEFTDLIIASQNLSVLIRAIYDSSGLSFIDGKRLTLKRESKDDALEALRFIDPIGYREKVEALHGTDTL